MAKRPKVKRFSIQAYDNKHYQTTEQYTRAVDALFDAATKAITLEAAKGNYDPDKPFEFADHPKVKAVMQQVTAQLASRLTAVIESGSRKQWLFSCEKNDGFVASIMDTSKLSKARLKKMQDRNLDALSAFQERKVNGMNLSQRVWKYVGQYKDQMEDALDVGLGEGRSAQQLARDVKQNLREPNRLFRRVRDKRGNLVLSKNAKAYSPGTGVYRSSVKNAQRLTRSEINMAYRESDWQRWQTLDFVVGFEILRSNHDPLPDCTLCDKLKGKYPKSFKFKGWHPQCMCYCIPILADEETFDENELGDLKAALHGTTYEHKAAKNTVLDVPQAFKDWVDEHKDAQENWGSTPYFVKDNFVDGDLSKGLKFEPLQVKQQIENSVVPTHVPLSEMPEADVQAERARWLELNKELEEMEDALFLYSIPSDKAADLVYNVIYGSRKDAEYWRFDEAKAEIERLKQGLCNVVDATKKQARQLITAYHDAIDDALPWIDAGTYVSVYLKATQMFDGEKQKKYGNYLMFTNASMLQTSNIAPLVADMKAKYNKAIADANAVITNANGADVSRLKKLVATTPHETTPAYKIVADIEESIKRIHFYGQKVSCPDELKTGAAYLKGEDYTFDEEFFALLDPIKNVVLTIKNDDSGSYESGSPLSKNIKVVIANKKRCNRSPWEKKAVIYHEYGHAIGDQRAIPQGNDIKFTDMRNGQKKMLKKKAPKEIKVQTFDYEKHKYVYEYQKAKSLVHYIDHQLERLTNKAWGWDDDYCMKKWGYNHNDIIEMIASTRDTIKSLVPSYGAGHTDSYFRGFAAKEHEYLAHCFENTFIGNPIFKLYMPDIYNEMVAYIRQLKPM